jgi:putative hydrolase of the HAD superfamily
MIRAIVFDLDDTLYREKDFVTSGFRAVAQYLVDTYGYCFQHIFPAMMTTFEEKGRNPVFDMLRDEFLDSSIPVSELVDVYRRHRPSIRLFPGYSGLLKWLARYHRLGIITDGLPEVQQKKVQALRLQSLMDCIVYTWEFGVEKEKPHPFPFSLMLESLGADSDSVLFVGDNPDKDCRGAHGAGMKYAQLQTNGLWDSEARSGLDAPEFTIDTLFQLPPILRKLNGHERN